MKLFRLAMILIIAVTALGVGTMPAQAAAGRFTYMSSIQVQNLDNVAGHITLTFYNPDGTTSGPPVTDPIAANGQNAYFPLPSSVGTSFNGSVIITSETNIASISNVHGGQGTNAFYASGAYIAQSAGDTTISIPILMKGNGTLNTWFNIQNAGTADATNVDVIYSDGTSSLNNSIKKGAAKTFDQSAETHTAKVFAATVTSDQPVVITVIEEDASLLYAYNGFTTGNGAQKPVFPLFHANNNGFFTAINVQNQGTTATDVTISYVPAAAGTACTEKQTIQSKKVAVFGFVFAAAPGTGVTSNCIKGQRFVGSAVVTVNSAGNNLVAVVNQFNSATVKGGAYDGFNPASATGKVVLPLVFDRRAGYWTSAGFRNVGTVATSITCTFTPPEGSTTSYSWTSNTLNPGEGYTHFHYGLLGNNYRGSASCKANATGGKIVAIVNELGASNTTDELLVYEGINTAP